MAVHHEHASDDRINRVWLVRLGLVVGVCAIFAAMMPQGLVLPALSSLLTLGAFASALLAGIAREPVWPGHLTRWDQGSVLLALSILVGWAADPQAAADALSRLEEAGNAAPS
jgi:hypothetical protein